MSNEAAYGKSLYQLSSVPAFLIQTYLDTRLQRTRIGRQLFQTYGGITWEAEARGPPTYLPPV